MWYNLGKYGQVNVPGTIDYPGGKVNMEYLERIIEEAKAVGKVPWCASEWHEMAAAEILGLESETRKETYARRINADPSTSSI